MVNDAAAMQKFQARRRALERALAPARGHGELPAAEERRALPATCRRSSRATENRITVARNRFIAAVKDFNILARQFPTNLTAMILGTRRSRPSRGEREGHRGTA
jgi:LemA protein